MLEIVVPGDEQYDDETQEFIYTPDQILRLEHSLVSISKWEAKWHIPFLNGKPKTRKQELHYIKCMTINEVDPYIYTCLTNENIKQINSYIEDPMTATTFTKLPGGGNSGVVTTSELIYYYLIALQIPFECQHWHLNRLMTLIEVCNRKNQPQKKMSQQEILSRNAALNAARRKQYNSKG